MTNQNTERHLTGRIVIQGGKVTQLVNLSDLCWSLLLDGELSHILPTLEQAGWRLTGDYTLTINRLIEMEDHDTASRTTKR